MQLRLTFAPYVAALAFIGPVVAQDIRTEFPEDVLGYPEYAIDDLRMWSSPWHHFEFATVPLGLPLQAVEPFGSFAYLGSADGTLALVGAAEDFESGALGGAWTTQSSAPEGRIQVTDQFGAASGSFAMLMDTTVSGPNVLNEAIWTVDLSGQSSAVLQFSHADFADEETGFSGPFTGSFNADGVAISADGTNWFPVWDAPSQATGQWLTYEIDLGAAAASNSIALGAGFQIKFQQYDNFPLSTDGRGYDAISILAPGIDADDFTFDVDPGQHVTLVVDPEPGVQATVTLRRGPAVLGTATAAAPGEDAVLQVVATSGSLTGFGGNAQTYTATVSSTTTAIGNYELGVVLNAALEAEEHDGPTNDSIATAQDLSAAFMGLHSAAPASSNGPKPERSSVIGALGSVLFVGDDFESGSLGAQWSTFSSDPQGRIRVSGVQGTAAGAFAVLMDRDPSGSNTLNEIVWTVDLTGLQQALLVFAHAEWGDETHNFSGPFVDHFNADGVAISADGTNWFPVLDMPNQSNGVWQEYEVDLVAAAAAANIALGANFQIKFQQYDNFPIATDGRGWDEVRVVTGTSDYYCVPLEARETLSAAAVALSGADVAVDLLDANGNVLSAGAGTSIDNGSFESGDFTGWTTVTTGTPFRPWAVSGPGVGGGFNMDDTDPQDGAFVAWNGFDGVGPMDFELFQDVTIGGGATQLTWSDRVQWNFTLGANANLPRTYDVEVRDPGTNAVLATLHSFATGTQATTPEGDTGWVQRSADLAAFAGQTVRLVFTEHIPESGTGPGQYELDGVAFSSSSNADSLVRNFQTTRRATYYVRVTGANTGYNLVLHRNADLNIEANDSIGTADVAAARVAAGRRWMTGHLDAGAGDASDYYRISVDGDSMLNVATHTPGDGMGVFLNDLDPMLRLYDDQGTLLLEDDGSGDDMINAVLTYTTAAGPARTYYVEVLASPATGPTSGAYVVSFQGNN